MKKYLFLSIGCFLELSMIFATGTADSVKRPGESVVALVVVVAIFVLLFVGPKIFKRLWIDKNK